MSLVRAINPAFPALLPKPVPGLFCGRVIPGSSEVPSESSVIASHSLPAPLCSPSRVSSVGSVIESRSLSASPCLHVVPESSEVPSVNSDPHRLPETWTALLMCGSRILEGHLRGHVTRSRVVPESSEVPSVNSDPKRLPATWTDLLVCGSRILEGSLQGHVMPTHSVSCLPPRSVPAGSLLDRACLLDEGSARVGGFLALTRPAGRAHPRHSQNRASASPLPRPHRRCNGGGGCLYS